MCDTSRNVSHNKASELFQKTYISVNDQNLKSAIFIGWFREGLFTVQLLTSQISIQWYLAGRWNHFLLKYYSHTKKHIKHFILFSFGWTRWLVFTLSKTLLHFFLPSATFYHCVTSVNPLLFLGLPEFCQFPFCELLDVLKGPSIHPSNSFTFTNRLSWFFLLFLSIQSAFFSSTYHPAPAPGHGKTS